MSRADLLIHNADIGRSSNVCIRVDNGVISDITPVQDRATSTGHDVVDAAGGAVIPGLTDHHLHLHALAAAASSVQCGPPYVSTVDDLVAAFARAQPDSTGWIRGVGYSETVAGEPDRHALDRIHSSHPIRIQHRSGALWILNTAAADAVGLASADHPGVERLADGQPTGRLWRADAWLRTRLPHSAPPDLTEVGRQLARYGLTSVTDATPNLTRASRDSIVDAIRAGRIQANVCLLGAPVETPESSAGDWSVPVLSHGPYKIVLADSGLPDLDDLVASIDRAHRAGRCVAVHCVSTAALALLLAAFDEAGAVPGDRIEHASIVPADCIPRLRSLGLRVVTQPGFIADRGDDYLRDVDPRDLPGLYRCRSLMDASVPLALSSDAPYGPLDPWAVISAAVRRRTRSGAVVGPPERITTRSALDAYLSPAQDPGGAPRRIAIGEPADLVVLAAPLQEVLESPSADMVLHTYLGGVRI